MKNKFFRFSMILCLCFFLQVTFAFAAEDQQEYVIKNAVLDQSEDKAAIEALAEEIVQSANLFEEENVHANEADIDFSSAYCVYVDADIFANLPMTRQNLEAYMQSASKVWVVPVRVEGKTVIVQISKAPELSEVDLTNITSEEQQDIEARAGKWQVVASTCYEGNIDYGKQLRDALGAQGKNAENTECVLFGGVPGIQSVLAVVLEGDSATGIVSMERDIHVEGNPKAKSEEKDLVFEKNVMYPIEKYTQGVERLRNVNETLPDSTGGAAGAASKDVLNPRYFMAGGIAVILIIGFLLFAKQYRRKNRASQ